MQQNAATERTATIFGATGAGLALVCMTMLTAYLGLDPHHLDAHLQSYLTAISIALPLLVTAGLFGLWAHQHLLAGGFFLVGGVVLGNGMYDLLAHFDSAYANAFSNVSAVCGVTLLAYSAWFYIRPKVLREAAKRA